MAWGKAYLFQHKYKFRGFQLRTGVFCVLFLLTVRVQEVGAAVVKDYNEACTPVNPDEQCAGNLVCVNSVCGCAAGNYYHTVDKTCKPIKDHNEACTPGDPDEQCAGNLICENSVCGCAAGNYYHETDKTCKPKIAHGENCNIVNQPSNVCQEANTACILSHSGESRCLCTTNYYRSTGDAQCNPLNELKVSNIRALQRFTNNVTLTWDADKHGTSVIYTIQPSGGEPPVPGITVNASPVTGLTPGAQYTFTITSVLPAAGFYPEKSVTTTTGSGFWTKPAKPGTVTSAQLVTEVPVVYDIKFVASQGQVSNYKMTVNSETVQSTGSVTTVRFTSLQPGQSYNYSITAYNGNNDASEPYTGTLKTPVIASGPVSELVVSDITVDRAKVTWKKPVRPNGDIRGYTLTVIERSTCVYGHIINCSDCPKPGPSGHVESCQGRVGESKTLAVLNDNTTTFTVQVSDLEPYRNYTARVTADTNEGIGRADNTLFRTLVAAARDVTNVTATSRRNSITGVVSLTVTWTPGYFTGPTRYLVTLEEEISLDSNSFIPVTVEIVTGYGNTVWTKPDVLAYWNYRVSVLAMTDAGNSSLVGSKPVQTTKNTPGLTQDFTVQQDETVAQELALTITCPEEKERNGIITGYIIRKRLLNTTGNVIEENEYTVTADSFQTCINTYMAKDVGGIIVGRNYTFTVKVKNSDYIGTYSREVILCVEPKAPRFEEILQSHGISSLVRQQEGSSIQQTAIDVTVCTSCLLDSRQGTVTQVGLLLCQVGSDGNCIGAERKMRSLVNFEDYTTWSRTRAQGFTAPYRATPDDWMSTLTDPHTSYPYRIGADTNCQTTVVNTVYCNGPLPTDTRFRVAVIQCNSVGCVIGTFEGPFRTGDDDSETTTLPIVLGVVIPVVIIIVIIIVIVIFIKRRRGEQHKKQGDQRPYNTMNTAMNDAHLYHGVTGRTYVSPPHTNHDGQDNIAMAGLQTHQASLYQRDVTEYTEPDHYDYIGDNGRQNSENQPSQSHDRVGQPGEGEQNRINPYNNISASENAQRKKDYYNM